MFTNEVLLQKLRGGTFQNGKSDEITNLLDAILSVNPEEKDALQSAIKPFTEMLGGEEISLDANRKPSFIEIQQAAAAERVKFVLNTTTDVNILITILKNNPDECRAYLAEKLEPKLSESYYWKNSTLNLENEQTHDEKPEPVRWVLSDGRWRKAQTEADKLRAKVLPDAQIEEIKKLAAARWVSQKTNNAPLEVLNKLSSNNKGSFYPALRQLGYSGDFKHIDVPIIKGLAKDKVQLIKTQSIDRDAEKDNNRSVPSFQIGPWGERKAQSNTDTESEGNVNRLRQKFENIWVPKPNDKQLDRNKSSSQQNEFSEGNKNSETGNVQKHKAVFGEIKNEGDVAKSIPVIHRGKAIKHEVKQNIDDTVVEELESKENLHSDDKTLQQGQTGHTIENENMEVDESSQEEKQQGSTPMVNNPSAPPALLADEQFIAQLKKQINNLSYSELVTALPALQENTPEGFRGVLSQVVAGDFLRNYIFTEENTNDLKKQIMAGAVGEMKKVISQGDIKQNREEKLAQLQASETSKEFHKKLANILSADLRQAIPHIDGNHMLELQQTARRGQLEIQIELYSIYGKNRHPAFIEMFDKLSVDGQRELLIRNRQPDKNPDMPHMLRATNSSILERYLRNYMWPVDKDSLEKLQQENSNNSLLKSIHNYKVMETLLKFPSNIVLDEEQLKDINSKFTKYALFGDKANYIALIHDLKNESLIEVSDEGKFYEAFGLKENGAEVKDTSMQEAISKQHEYNLPLFDVNPQISPKLVSFLLRLNKNDDSKIDDEDVEKDIEFLFRLSNSSSQFIDSYIRPEISTNQELTKEQLQVKKELALTLTPELFREIKNEMLQQMFERTEQVRDQLVGQMEGDLKQCQKTHKKAAEFIEKTKFVHEVKPIHIHNPKFRSISEKMRAKYEETLVSCDTLIDQLLHNRQRLQDYMMHVPFTDQPIPGQEKASDRVNKLKPRLDKQINQIDEQLRSCEDIRARIHKTILPMINADRTKSYAYKPDSVVTFLIRRDQEQSELIRSQSGSENQKTHTTIEYGLGNPKSDNQRISKFELEYQPKYNEVRCFDVTYTTEPKNSTPPIQLKGRFIFDGVNPRAADSINPGKYVIRKFPEAAAGVTQEELVAAKVNFAMSVATQVLATMDGPPSKKNPIRLRNGSAEELHYVWTAFAILGENIPGMRFKENAIKVTSTSFDPAKLFKKTPEVMVFIEDTKEQVRKLRETKDINKTEKKLERSTEFYKDGLNAIKAETEARQKKQGFSPEPADKTSLIGPRLE